MIARKLAMECLRASYEASMWAFVGNFGRQSQVVSTKKPLGEDSEAGMNRKGTETQRVGPDPFPAAGVVGESFAHAPRKTS